jgi:iron complex transport system substrate-binding protein
MKAPARLPGLNRRTVLAAGSAALAGAAWAQPATVTDSAGRAVPVPKNVQRVFPAGPPAAILLYTLAPDLLLGWPRANRPEELEFRLPGIGNRPELGRITGRGNSANLEAVLAARPDLIVDSGSVRDTYVELAQRVQQQTGIPYALLDGRLPAIPRSYTLLGELLDLLGEVGDEPLGLGRKIAGLGIQYARRERGLQSRVNLLGAGPVLASVWKFVVATAHADPSRLVA